MYPKDKETLYRLYDEKIKPVVEMEGQLYINLGVWRDAEEIASCTYYCDYKLLPYAPELEDQIYVNEEQTTTFKFRGGRDPLVVREDKIPFEVCGFSDTDGKQVLVLRRKYPEKVIVPTK